MSGHLLPLQLSFTEVQRIGNTLDCLDQVCRTFVRVVRAEPISSPLYISLPIEQETDRTRSTRTRAGQQLKPSNFARTTALGRLEDGYGLRQSPPALRTKRLAELDETLLPPHSA